MAKKINQIDANEAKLERINTIKNNINKLKPEEEQQYKIRKNASFHLDPKNPDYFDIEDYIELQTKRSCCCSLCYHLKPDYLHK